MNNKIQITTTGLLSQVILEDLGNLVLNHPTAETVQDYISLEKLITLSSIIRELDAGNITINIGSESINTNTNLDGLNIVYLLKELTRLANLGFLNFIGLWDATTNTPTLIDGVGTKGDYYKVNVAGSTNLDGNSNWTIGDLLIYNGIAWDLVQGGTSDIVSVAGKTGVVTLTKSDVDLNNVDNTSDANKPISTATQAALETKAELNTTIAYAIALG